MHWTYAQVESDDLSQGDILAPTPELRQILDHVHPYFSDEKYMGFMITTQSCDLVRRPPAPKAQYINISSIRSLKEIGPRLLRSAVKSAGPCVFYRSDKARAKDLFSRIFNQNEQSLGLFYLHPSPELNLGDPAVALLRVTISLKAEHYDALLRARVGTLSAEFRAKLGWLVGNLYSRAATRDWQDTRQGAIVFDELLAAYTDDSEHVQWVDDVLIESALRGGVDLSAQPPEEVRQILEPYRPPTARQKLEEEAGRLIERVLADRDPFWKDLESASMTLGSILSDPEKDEAEKDEARRRLHELVKKQFGKLPKRLSNSGVVKTLLK